MQVTKVRDFSRYGDAVEIPDLIQIQTESYARFLQTDRTPGNRRPYGLEALLREVYPIESYDGNMTGFYTTLTLPQSERREVPVAHVSLK